MCTAKPRPVISRFQGASEAERIARGCGFRQLPGGNPSEMENRKIENGRVGLRRAAARRFLWANRQFARRESSCGFWPEARRINHWGPQHKVSRTPDRRIPTE